MLFITGVYYADFHGYWFVRYRRLAQAQAVWLIVMTPEQVKVMAAIRVFDASEQLADATDDLIEAHAARRAGLLVNCAQFEEVAKIRLAAYRQARADYESLQ